MNDSADRPGNPRRFGDQRGCIVPCADPGPGTQIGRGSWRGRNGRQIGDDHRMSRGGEVAGQRLRDPVPIAGQEKRGGQRILGRGAVRKRRLDRGRREPEQIGTRLRDRAEGGGQGRGRGEARGGERALHVIDDVGDGGRRPEQVPRQAPETRPRLLEIRVQLDRHERVESQLAPQRLRRLQRARGKRADPRDGGEDPLGNFVEAHARRRNQSRALLLGAARLHGQGRGAQRHDRSGRVHRFCDGDLDAASRERCRLLFQDARVRVEDFDLLPEEGDDAVLVLRGHGFSCGGGPDRLRRSLRPLDGPVGLSLDGRGGQGGETGLAPFEERERLEGNARRPE